MIGGISSNSSYLTSALLHTQLLSFKCWIIRTFIIVSVTVDLRSNILDNEFGTTSIHGDGMHSSN